MSLCVNISSKEFKDAAKRLDIDEVSLENIIHEFINSEGNANAFPSDSYILSKVEGVPFTKLSEKEQQLIDQKYSRPFTVESYEDAQAIIADMSQYFDPIHIGLKKTLDGKYKVTLAHQGVQRTGIEVRDELKKLSTLNGKKISALGSTKKMIEALKNAGVTKEIIDTLVQGLQYMPSLKTLNPKDALMTLASLQYDSLIEAYDKAIKSEPNEKLNSLLEKYLQKYSFDINIGEAIKRFGDDVTGVLDIINKIIYLANNENGQNALTFPEEFGHAFVELMGSTTGKRAENADFTFLMNSVESTDLYKRVLEEYSDVYKLKDGSPDIYKIKKEAIGKAIGIALVQKTDTSVTEKDRSFIERVREFIQKIFAKFRGQEYLSFESLVNKIADEVLAEDTSRLNKVDQSKYKLLDYYQTIEEQNKRDGGKALEFLRFFSSIGNDITGSLAYRLQGAVYRGKLDSLHDIDMQVPQSAHGISFSSPDVARVIELARQRNQTELFEVITNSPYFQNIKERYPKVRFGAAYADSKGKNRITVNAVYSEDVSLSERFLKMTGSYAERLDNFTEAERSQIYLFDFFLNGEGEEYTSFFEPTYGINLVDFDKPLREKRWMGRAKDQIDYQNWRVFDEFKGKIMPSEEDLMYQLGYGEERRNPIDSANDLRTQKIAELNSKIEDIQSAIKSLDRKSYINDIIADYNKRVKEAKEDLRRKGTVTGDSLYSIITEFNEKYSDLINLGVIDAIPYNIGQKIAKFDSDGRAKYPTSRIPIVKEMAAIKRLASDQLKEFASKLNSDLAKAKEELRRYEETPFGDVVEQTLSSEDSYMFQIKPGAEKQQISSAEKNFVTEVIKVPGLSNQVTQETQRLWSKVKVVDNTLVTIPYSEWKALDTTLTVYQDGLAMLDIHNQPIFTSSLEMLIEELQDEWDQDWGLGGNKVTRYNKNDKTITVPQVLLNLAKLIKNLYPIQGEVVSALREEGYDTVAHGHDVADAVIALALSDDINFGKFIEDIGGEYAYIDSRQQRFFDDYGNVTEEARVEYQEDGLSAPTPQTVRPELQGFQTKAASQVEQLNNLLDSDLMSNTEVRHVAEQAVYFISDSITEFLEDPSKIFTAFPELATKNGNPMTEEERNSEIERIKGMSRVELARYLSPERLIEFTKARLFTPQGNPNINTRDLIKKARLIRDNFDAVLKFAGDAFAIVEDFAITSTGERMTLEENLSPLGEDYDKTNDADYIAETEGSLQEHWQIESRTLDVMSSMSQLVKQALNKCFQIRINPETGMEEHVPSEFGIAERVNAKDATSSILRWTRGAESLSHMLQLIEQKVPENPWVKQIVDRLKDTSGNESDFQSQFYGVFAKAFQPYSVILKERNEKTGDFEYRSIQVNEHPALTEATKSIEVAYKTNAHPLFDNGSIRKDVLDTLTEITKTLVERAQNKLEENNRAELVDLLTKASAALGYTVDPSVVNLALDTTTTFHNMVNYLNKISDKLNKALGVENYDPFKFGSELGIRSFLSYFLAPLTERLEETAVSSFYDSGKMYQSYVTPSYLTVLMNHLTSEDTRFQEFLESEYGAYEWFRNSDGSWKNLWLEQIDDMSQEERKGLLKHKVQLNFNKHNYMRNMSDVEYALSIFSEYFSEFGGAKGTTVPVWFRIPMMSNKPSSEFIRMNAYTGTLMKYMLTNGFNKIFQQELGRIQTVEVRDYDKSDPNFIKNFDKNGRKFVMLNFFNKYLKEGKEANSELGKLINKAIEQGTTKLSTEEQARLNELVNGEIVSSMDTKADAIIAEWKANGIFEGAKQVTNIGKEDSTVEERLREFIWNDTFASMNILELTITDPAFYKDAEDLQKRLAQIHAPGIRANVEAIDYQGNRVTDGKFRTILLKDFDDFISNIKDNLRIVFDRKLQELENSGVSKDSAKYKAAAATYENVINQFDNINVADAQGYSSPTSYRKKAFIFGKWSKSAEEIYNKLKEGKYNYSDLKTAFQPLKPFVYGQIEKPGIDAARSDVPIPFSKLKVPVQFKNSEYLLIMADAILQGEETGKPNLLRAIYEVMEESAENNPTRGIDTIQFESTCKSGLMAPIDIKQFFNMKGGETMAKLTLEQAIYNTDGSYNTGTYVYEVPFENYAIQQEVPEHFKNHYQAHGSQIRYIIPTDLETVDSDGNPVTYDYFDRGEQKRLSAEEFKREYEQNISENIEASIEELSEQLGIGNAYLNKRDRNIALSKILIEEIYASPRYGADLVPACTVNSETGEFNIPLGDPIQSKRIEQLINSVVKNRINKQEIAGGPVVQVTNFGTSRELNIRFNSKDGGLLMTRAEFENSGMEGTFEDYVKKNQAGIAYYEVFAPIFSNELFEKFADKQGNIDIETIEAINPDLLKMIGYRIPTEDKYSAAPLKIVGFLPREAGDGIMLPNDITLLTGSDFDVDKFYLMRKEIGITHRFLGDMSSYTIGEDSEVNVNKASIRKELLKRLETLYQRNMRLPESIKGRVEERADIIIEGKIEEAQKAQENRYNLSQYRVDAINRQKGERLSEAQDEYDRNADVIEKAFKDNQISEEEYTERMDKLDSSFDKKTKSIEDKFQEKLDKVKVPNKELTEEEISEIRGERSSLIYDLAKVEQKELIKRAIDVFLEDPYKKASTPLLQDIKDAYIKYMFDFVEDTEGTTYRNNKIVDMSWAVLTNETTASKILNPGGFEPEKRMGYLISAYQNPANSLSWEELNAITDIDELKSLCYTDKNLCFIDTHLQFYKQNSAAATALGMAAVQKVAHAVLESNGFRVDVENALNFEEEEFFSIAGKEFSGVMEIDRKYNDEGALIGRTLGEFVAMFADAVKDPVANLMNINSTTMPIVTSLIRFGMPFENVALFISQPAIRRVLELFNSENVTNFVRLSDVISKQLKDIEQYYDIEKDSYLKELNTITKEELINNLGKDRDAVTDYKVLKFFQYVDTLSKTLKSPTYATRFNSISNAVGPLVIDNLIMEYKAEEGNFDNFYDADGDEADINTIMDMHPILGSFYKALGISREILDEMPANSLSFRNMLSSADSDVKRALFGDRKTLSELSDFYQSYLLIASGAIPTEATKENPHQGLKYYLEKFPEDFMRAKAKELFKGNALIDAIKLDIQKGRAILKVDTTGLTTQDKERLGDGWADLYKSGERGRKLAEHLFYYNFWRTGIGFSPKSFMGLFPTRLKSKIRGYNEAFTVHSDRFAANVEGAVVLDQFVRNNADNNKIAPKIKIGEGGVKFTRDRESYVFSEENYEAVKDKFYIKIKSGNRDILLKRIGDNDITRSASYVELSLLGNNGEYFEASLNRNYIPLTQTTEAKQQNNEGQMEEVENNQVHIDDVPVVDKATSEQQTRRAEKIKDMLLKMFMMTGRTEEQAQAKIDEFKAKSDKEKSALRNQMKKFIANKFEQMGIKYNEKLLEEMYEELC